MPQPKVELIPAFMWICPECGHDNFVRAIIPEMSDSDRQALAGELGLDSDSEHYPMFIPDEATCHTCGGQYETAEFGEEID
jgi:hypothetical protein